MMKDYERAMRQGAYDVLAYGSSDLREAVQALSVEIHQTEVGKLIFAEAREDGTTRLFLKRLSAGVDVLTKKGWWDMFIVTNTPCRKGIWSCEIAKLRTDRNGFPMMEVIPLAYLGENINGESVAWDYFARSGMFSKVFINTDHYKRRFNVQEVEKRFYDFWSDYDNEATKEYLKKHFIPNYTVPARKIWVAFCEGKVTLQEIEDALDTPEGFEAMAIDIAKNNKKYQEKYPLMMAKICGLCNGYVSIDTIENYLFSRYYPACDLQRDGKIGKEIEGVFELIEASIQYYADIKKAEKEAKKAARKAKKAEKACS